MYLSDLLPDIAVGTTQYLHKVDSGGKNIHIYILIVHCSGPTPNLSIENFSAK